MTEQTLGEAVEQVYESYVTAIGNLANKLNEFCEETLGTQFHPDLPEQLLEAQMLVRTLQTDDDLRVAATDNVRAYRRLSGTVGVEVKGDNGFVFSIPADRLQEFVSHQ